MNETPFIFYLDTDPDEPLFTFWGIHPPAAGDTVDFTTFVTEGEAKKWDPASLAKHQALNGRTFKVVSRHWDIYQAHFSPPKVKLFVKVTELEPVDPAT